MINADKKKEMKNLSEMLLETRNLTKQYGHHKAVDSVNMHIKKGAIYGFIGRNGAGKTTCLKMISGLSKPTCGEIEMFGYKGKDLKKVQSRIGCLIEAPGLYGNMTAYENLNIKCKLFGIKKKSYIEEILRIIGLEDVGKKKTKHFSLGMKQRLGIGLALVGEPDLLVLENCGKGAEKEPKKGAERKQAILDILIEYPTITQTQLMEIMNLTRKQVQKDMKELQEEGVLIREGTNRTGRWVVKEYEE